MAPPRDRLYAMAREVLDVVVAGYLNAAIAAGADWPPAQDLPARQFVSIGPPAWDCALIAVWVETTNGSEGDVRVDAPDPHKAGVGHGLRTAALRIQIVRCVPVMEEVAWGAAPPDAADEEAAAEVLLTDAQLVTNILLAASKAGELGTCNDVVFTEWLSVGPEGGMAASTHALRAAVAR